MRFVVDNLRRLDEYSFEFVLFVDTEDWAPDTVDVVVDALRREADDAEKAALARVGLAAAAACVGLAGAAGAVVVAVFV